MTWQPIQTAPKDGTLIVGYMRDTVIVKLSWWSKERRAADNGGKPENYQEGWYDLDEDEWSPTHWAPLSEPPEPTP